MHDKGFRRQLSQNAAYVKVWIITTSKNPDSLAPLVLFERSDNTLVNGVFINCSLFGGNMNLMLITSLQKNISFNPSEEIYHTTSLSSSTI